MAELLIGLMTGTSMDSVDAVLAHFTGNTPRLMAKHATPIPSAVRHALLALARPGPNELDGMARLDATLARLFAGTVQDLLLKADVVPNKVRAIGSHGQTIRHSPAGPEPYTLQIGNPNLLAELTGILTVADFRRRDMAAGGQGAPLAPAFHAAFFRHPDESRVVVNMGGIANITILPADRSQPVRGFDTGPGNVLLDAWTQRHLGTPLDHEGAWGSTGCIIPALLQCCLDDPYFTLPPPKSTGRERFNLTWLEEKLAAWGGKAVPQDVQATLIALTTHMITTAIRQYAEGTQRVLVGGGGVHNRAIMAGLQHQLGAIPVQSTETQGVDPDYVEAIGFAWLAKRTLDGQPGNLPEVTGARGLRILGGIYPA